jgi:hypothetical protein
MPRVITAAEARTQKRLDAERRLTAEEREFRKKRAELEQYQDLRDDVMALVRNSSFTFELIHARCGPHPGTLKKWDEKTTDKPQLGKMRSTLRILGYDLGIVERGASNVVALRREGAA